jgi:hypothetical protein
MSQNSHISVAHPHCHRILINQNFKIKLKIRENQKLEKSGKTQIFEFFEHLITLRTSLK